MLVILEDARLRAQFKKFRRTGAIPEAVYAGEPLHSESSTDLIHWAKTMLIVETHHSYIELMAQLRTVNTELKIPYVLSKYKKDFNPTIALYEEYQKALFVSNPNKFDLWIIEICNSNIDSIVDDINTDTNNITSYLDTYKNSPEQSSLTHLLHRLNKCLIGFSLQKYQ